MFLISAICVLLPAFSGAAPSGPQGDSAVLVRRIAATAALAAEEYGNGVQGGRVIAPAEVEEAKLFLAEARRSADLLPAPSGKAVVGRLDGLLGLVSRAAPADSVATLARALGSYLAATFDVVLDEIPDHAPALALGARIYEAQCAACHGPTGRGDGPAGSALLPSPADLTDFRKLSDATPLDFYRRITIGVTGTAMPAFESRLSPEERWAVALYATVLRTPAPEGEVPAELRGFPATARMSDARIAAIVAPGAAPDEIGRAHV